MLDARFWILDAALETSIQKQVSSNQHLKSSSNETNSQNLRHERPDKYPRGGKAFT